MLREAMTTLRSCRLLGVWQNVMDAALGAIFFGGIGYGVAYGDTGGYGFLYGVAGKDSFLLNEDDFVGDGYGYGYGKRCLYAYAWSARMHTGLEGASDA